SSMLPKSESSDSACASGSVWGSVVWAEEASGVWWFSTDGSVWSAAASSVGVSISVLSGVFSTCSGFRTSAITASSGILGSAAPLHPPCSVLNRSRQGAAGTQNHADNSQTLCWIQLWPAKIRGSKPLPFRVCAKSHEEDPACGQLSGPALRSPLGASGRLGVGRAAITALRMNPARKNYSSTIGPPGERCQRSRVPNQPEGSQVGAKTANQIEISELSSSGVFTTAAKAETHSTR